MTATLAVLTGVIAASIATMLLGRRAGRVPSGAASSGDPVSRELTDLREDLAAGELSARDYAFLRDRLAARVASAPSREADRRPAHRWRWPLGGLLAAVAIAATLVPALRDRSPGGFGTGNDFSDQGMADPARAAWRDAERAVAAGDLQRAVSRYRVAVAFSPDLPELRSRFGFALAQAKRTVEAEEQLRRAVRAQPRLPNARLYLGAVLMARGRRDEAARQWRTYLMLQPRGADAELVRRTLRRLR